MTDTLAFDYATARMALPLLFAAQARKEVFHNEALARIDGLMHAGVLGEKSAPPLDPTDGDCWLISALPDGAWTGMAGALAMRQNGQWLFAKPVSGMRIFDASLQQFRHFSDGWQKAQYVEEPTGGLNVDSQARAAIGALISALRASGIFPSA